MPTPAAAMASANARGTPLGSTVSRPADTTGATHVGFASQLRAVATTPEARSGAHMPTMLGRPAFKYPAARPSMPAAFWQWAR